jgi:5'-nucleotidase
MKTLLLSNDDGVQAPGLLALKQALEKFATVIVLAPEVNWSASGHARTLDRPLRVVPVRLADGSEAHACNGSPADCVALALHGVFGVQFDAVIGGMNSGYNLGNDVNYSGTVSCAREAVIFDTPGLAVSTASALQSDGDMEVVRPSSARIAAKIIAQILTQPLRRGTLININVPGVEIARFNGIRTTRLGWRSYNDTLIRREDPYGRPYYWLSGSGVVDDLSDGTDLYAIANHYASVTPLTVDATHHDSVALIRSWELSLDEV